MAIVQTPQSWIKRIAIIGVVAILAACGGGGSDSDSSNSSSAPSIDTTPEAFSFSPLDNQLRSEEVISNSVTITGINSATTIAITNGQYAIGEAAFTEAAGTITNGQSVKVKLTASENTFTETTATLTVGGVSATFTVKTQPDIKPDPFSFTPAENVEPASVNTSNKILLSGFDIAVPITIEGGEYALDDGEFTTADGKIEPGQSVTVRMTASEALTDTVETMVTIGGVAGTYVVTTLADTTAPTAQITFPPPMSMKDDDRILVRGTATDDYSAVKRVLVNGVEAETDDGFANWTAEIPLANGINTIHVTAVDGSKNESKSDNAADITVHRAPFESAFPAESAEETPLTLPTSIVLDQVNNRFLVTNLGPRASSIIAVDIATGERTSLSDYDTPNSEGRFGVPNDIAIDPNPERNRAIVAEGLETILVMNLDDGSRSILSDVNTPPLTEQPAIEAPSGIALDSRNLNIAYVIDEDLKTLQKIDLSSGQRTLISNNDPRFGDELFTTPVDLVIDPDVDRAYVTDVGDLKILSVDLTTGKKNLLFSGDFPNPENGSLCAMKLAIDNIQKHLYVSDCVEGVVVFDLLTKTKSEFFAPLDRPGSNYGALFIENGAMYGVYADSTTQALYAIDLKSLDFVTISKSLE